MVPAVVGVTVHEAVALPVEFEQYQFPPSDEVKSDEIVTGAL